MQATNANSPLNSVLHFSGSDSGVSFHEWATKIEALGEDEGWPAIIAIDHHVAAIRNNPAPSSAEQDALKSNDLLVRYMKLSLYGDALKECDSALKQKDAHAAIKLLAAAYRDEKKGKTAESLAQAMSNLRLDDEEPRLFFKQLESLNRKLREIDPGFAASKKKLMLDVKANLPKTYEAWSDIKDFGAGAQLTYSSMKDQLQKFWERHLKNKKGDGSLALAVDGKRNETISGAGNVNTSTERERNEHATTAGRATVPKADRFNRWTEHDQERSGRPDFETGDQFKLTYSGRGNNPEYPSQPGRTWGGGYEESRQEIQRIGNGYAQGPHTTMMDPNQPRRWNNWDPNLQHGRSSDF